MTSLFQPTNLKSKFKTQYFCVFLVMRPNKLKRILLSIDKEGN
jgi:hypothetical protein